MIEELDYVELTEDKENLNLKKGSKGTVVYMGGKRKFCYVEFFENNETIACELIEVDKLKKL